MVLVEAGLGLGRERVDVDEVVVAQQEVEHQGRNR
jgi:hypothetical protein